MATVKKKKKEPVWSKQLNTGGSVIEASIWVNEVELENKETVEMYAVSLHRSFKRDGNWEQTQTLRPQDLLATAHLLTEAYRFCTEQSS